MPMSKSFSRARGTLDLEGRKFRVILIVAAAVLLTGWGLWFFKSTVTVYAVSHEARLEVDRASYPVEAPVAGRVVSSTLVMGRVVSAGEMLVELDIKAQSLEVGEERARLSGLAPQLAGVLAEIAEQETGRRDAQAATAAARAEAQARHEEARAAADLAVEEEQRAVRLAANGLIGQAELNRARAQATQTRAAAETLRLALLRIDADHRRLDTEYRIEIERLQRQASGLRAQAGTASATVERLQHQGELRRIVAPVAGTLAEVSPLRVGRVLQTGETVATIVPSGTLRIVAAFLPAEAFGRVRPGQTARLRLDGFPFTQYGSVGARVSSVASEVREGQVRVDLALADVSTVVPLQHGLPGTVEVGVEEISPAALALRAAGQRAHKRPARSGSSQHP
jgi:membrane fusion protein (multidrug efflux system)